MSEHCPNCGSKHVEIDGGPSEGGQYLEWFDCSDCGYKWKPFIDDEFPELNLPSLAFLLVVSAVLICVMGLILAVPLIH